MNAEYWNAAVVVMDHVRSIGSSKRTVAMYDRGIRHLADFLDTHELDFNEENAYKWSDATHCASSAKERKFVVRRMLEANENDCIKISRYSHPGPTNKSRLTNWSAKALSGFKESLDGVYDPDTTKCMCSNIAEFLVKGGLKDAISADEITSSVILSYLSSSDVNKMVRGVKLSHIRAFFRYLETTKECKSWAALLASDYFADYRECFSPIDAWEHNGGIDAEDYLEAVRCFIKLVVSMGYSNTMRKVFRKALLLLYVALAINNVPYTPANAPLWLDTNAVRFSTQEKSFRRAHFLFERFYKSGSIDADAIRGSNSGGLKGFPFWSREIVSDYLSLRIREGYSKSTLSCIKNALCRLAGYADTKGIRNWSYLNPQIVAQWCLDDRHKTYEGRVCYTAKVRCFLTYLEDEDVCPLGLSLAVCSTSAPHREIVTTLDDGQMRIALERRKQATTPRELRDAAIIALGLTMGLRSSDAVGLKLSDISWRTSSVTITQQKTLRQLSLPLSTAAGNAIAAYIRLGRPTSTSSANIFVKHRMPYTPLTTNACRSACKNTFGNDTDVTFHKLRRTYATRMLKGGAGRHGVAIALGHSTDETVDEYLCVDDERMLMCALSLSDLDLEAPVND